MLKLERVSHDNQVAIFVRDKKHLFTSSFLIALAIAMGTHALILILFHISPIKIRWGSNAVSPAIVEAVLKHDLPDAVTANADPAIHYRSRLPEPKLSEPTLPSIPAFSAMRRLEPILATSQSNPFSSIENEIYQPTFLKSKKEISKPLTLVIVGPLANRQLINNPASEIYHSKGHPEKPEEPSRVIYAVLVKGDSGQVFWYEKKEKSASHILEKVAEQTLLKLRFLPHDDSPIISGDIEFHLNPEYYD